MGEKEKIARNPRKAKNLRNPRKAKNPKVPAAQVLLNPVKKLSSVVVPAPAVPVVPAKIARNLKKVKNPRNPKNPKNPRDPKVPVPALVSAAVKKMEQLFHQENLLMDLPLVDIASERNAEKVSLGLNVD